MKLQEMVRHFVRFKTSEHTRTLEAEVMRLRSENRALLNSILGIAGVPPVTVTEEYSVAVGADAAARVEDVGRSRGKELKTNGSAVACGAGQALEAPATPMVDEKPRGSGRKVAASRATTATTRSGLNPAARVGPDGKMQAVTPTRRRSWQQINRTLEINSTKKKPQDADG